MLRIDRTIRRIGTCQTSLRRRNYGRSASSSGGQENLAFVTLLGLAGVITSATYVYYDPDVLPMSVKKWLSIQEPEGRGMSVEEYEQWRAKQPDFVTDVTMKEEENETERMYLKEKDIEPPNMDDDIPIPHGNESPAEMKASLERLLAEARENEAAFIADMKSNTAVVLAEDRQMLQAFKDEKSRIKKQLKFLKSNK